jgi:hypothetical protein
VEHFKATGARRRGHTLTIEVTGQQDPAAAKLWSWMRST